MRLRLLLAGALLLLGVQPFSWVQRSAAEEAWAQQPAPRPRVALVLKTRTNPFFVEMEKGARRAEAQWGVQLLVKTPPQETSVEQQITIIEQLVQARVDAIVIAPVDSARVVPALKKARDVGIVVVDVDTRLDAQAMRDAAMAPIPFISVDNEAGAYNAAKYLSRDVRAATEAAIIEGIRGTSTAQDRKQGALRAFSENPHIKVVASETANWKIGEAHDVAKQMFGTHPRIKLLFCANDLMALGAIRHLQEARIKGVKVASYDALEEARQAIRAGTLAATVDQQAGQQGFTGVAYAARLLKGEKLPTQTLLETQLVTK